MPSSNSSQSQNYGYITYNIGSSVTTSGTNSLGNVTISSSELADSKFNITFANDESMRFEVITDDGVDIGISTRFFGAVDGKRVQAKLEPEADMSPIESVRLSTLLQACAAGLNICPISFIKANNLSRHFRFSEV